MRRNTVNGFLEASVVTVASFCKLYGYTIGLAHYSFFVSSKAFFCILLNEKSLFLMLFKGSFFVAKSGVIFP